MKTQFVRRVLALFLTILLTISPLSVCASGLEEDIIPEETAAEEIVAETIPEETTAELISEETTVPAETEEPASESTEEVWEESVQPSEEPEEVPVTEDPVSQGSEAFTPGEDISDEELLWGYLYELSGMGSGIQAFAMNAYLTGIEKEVFDGLILPIQNIAAHGGSTVITVNCQQTGHVDIMTILYAILAEFPYDLYWFDKTSDTTMSWKGNSVTFYFPVVKKYQDGSIFRVTPQVADIPVAVGNARQIIAKHASKDNFGKLDAYRQEICDLVSYNYSAISSSYSEGYGDPWQLIYVFDGKPSTNVVCEGYAKAFKYLCDLSSWNGYVDCYTVNGPMNGGGHMWNIVTIDGANYLADITNCDSGTVGYPDKVFLKGVSGSYPTFSKALSSTTLSYTYDSYTREIYYEDQLILSPTDYGKQSVTSDIVSGGCGGGLTWELEDGTLTISGIGVMVDSVSGQAPWYPYRASIQKVVIENADSIGAYAFDGCSNLTEISIPASVKSFGSYAFSGCKKLTGIQLPKNMTAIADGTFCGCSALKTVSIPSTVTSIGALAFMGCTGLTGVSIPASVSAIGINAFSECAELSSVMFSSTSKLTQIPDGAFTGCSSLKYAAIPGKVTEIGCSAFADCTALEEVSLGSALIKIGDQAFLNCSGLTRLTLPSTLTTLGAQAFFGCMGLTSVVVPNSITTAGTACFPGTTQLTMSCTNPLVSKVAGNPVTLLHSQIPGGHKDPTCTEDGWTAAASCPDCGVSLAEAEKIPALGHTLTHFDAKNADYGVEGNLEYWSCSRCKKYFTDEACTTEASWRDIRIAPLGMQVLYELNGGTNNSENPDSFAYNSTASITLKAPVRTGYTFQGWYKDAAFTQAAAAPQLSASIAAAAGKSITFYAKWAVNTYKIVFNANGGTGTMPAITGIPYEREAALTANAYSRKGFAFLGWNTSADGSGQFYANSSSVTNLSSVNGASVTLYAQWSMEQYSISYELDGGLDNPNPESYNVTTAITLKEPVKPGYKFAGWYKNNTTRVTSIARGSTGSLSLTARWIPISYTIKYNLNGGKVSSGNPTKYNYGSSLSFSRIPTKKGYDFGGWYLDAAMTRPITEITPDLYGNLVLYAKWELITYQAVYDPAGGTLSTANPGEYTVLDAYALNAPTRPGYKFAGWYRDNSSKMAKISKGTVGDLNLVARWTPISYSIKYYLNGGTKASGTPSKYKTGDSIVLKAPSRKGAVFMGWYLDAEYTSPISQITPDLYGALTLYAKWELITYHITYITESGVEEAANPETYTVDSAFSLLAPTRPGFTFSGWYKANRTKTARISRGTIGDLEFTARWTAATYTIKYYLNGGKVSSGNPTKYKMGSDLAFTRTPVRVGYVFQGWYADAALTKPVSGITPDMYGNLTLYAKWG